jgi:hypothetical protein
MSHGQTASQPLSDLDEDDFVLVTPPSPSAARRSSPVDVNALFQVEQGKTYFDSAVIKYAKASFPKETVFKELNSALNTSASGINNELSHDATATPLWWALQAGREHIDVLHFLVITGADLRQGEKRGMGDEKPPLFMAIENPGSDWCQLRYLLKEIKKQDDATKDKGYPIINDTETQDGNTSLLFGLAHYEKCVTKRKPITINLQYLINLLCACGADINKANHVGDTPVIVAARLRLDDAVKDLVARGAKLNTPNAVGETAISIIEQRDSAWEYLFLRSLRATAAEQAAANPAAAPPAVAQAQGRNNLSAPPSGAAAADG